MTADQALRQELTNLLTVRQAHMAFEDAVANFPLEHINTRPPGCDYTFWHLVEHLRICQRDILDYVISDDYVWLTFPDDLWPPATAETDASGWQDSVNRFLADRQALCDLLNDPRTNLFAPLPNSGSAGHTLVREIHVVADHNAYHTGELAILRQVMGLWP